MYYRLIKNVKPILIGTMISALGLVSISSTAQAKPIKSKNKQSSPIVSYMIGEKSYIDSLFPTLTPSSDATCQPSTGNAMTTIDSIQCYVKQSLKNDLINATNIKVSLINQNGKQFYNVSFETTNSLAKNYSTVQPKWLNQTYAGQALKGVTACQANSNCWTPQPPDSKTCPAPWAFYLPLGLPMVSQNMIMLLHYPPYVSMEQYDYLNNNTLSRWARLFADVNGNIPSDVSLYQTIIDINPIAAPGSGESQCLTTNMAINYFDSSNNGLYISPMLNLLADPSTNPSTQNTRPVIAFGSEAREFLEQKYQLPSVNVLQAGTLKLGADLTKNTPYLGANHPIAAVYQKCSGTNPGIIAMEQQDLATSCFARTMTTTPDADPSNVISGCFDSFANNPNATNQALICINAHIDMGGLNEQGKPAVSWNDAQAWCNAHNQNPCDSTQ